MKRLFATSLLVALALLVVATGAVHAQPSSDGAQYAGSLETTAPTNIGDTAVETALQAGAAVSPYIAAPAPDPAAERVVAQLPPGPPDDSIFASVMQWVMSLFAWLVGVAFITLDYAVYYTVVTMGDYVNDLSAVGVTWRIMRDIGNIVIIFGFLAIGISIILNTERLGYGKKMLPMLLVSAVFLNFSLFISEAVIDTGNLFATQFYTQINGGDPAGAKPVSFSGVSHEGISNKIMSQLGLQTIYGDALKTNTQVFKSGNAFIIGFMGSILFIITAFVVFSLAFILIARFVILLLLIIIAPIGFAGLAVPKLASAAKEWWDELFKQTLTAPVLLLLLYIALAVITDVQFLTGFGIAEGARESDDFWTGFIDNGNLAGFASIMLSFLVAMGLLLAVVILSKRLSARGGSWATKWAGKLSGVSIAAGMPGWVGRNTAGAAGNYAAKYVRGKAWGRSFIGRGIADTLEKRVAGASFDIRNTDLGRSASKAGLDLGKGQTGGYKTDLEARVKSYERAAFAIEGRKKTKEEEAAMNQATANLEAAKAEKATTQHERDAVAAENSKQQAEIKRLEKEQEASIARGGPDIEIERKLDVARQSLATSETKLAAADADLARAEKVRVSRADEAAKLEEKINYATSKKGAQEKYAESLSAWGVVPLFGTAAAVAAKRVKGNAGKTKKQVDIEAALSVIQANAGATTPPAVATAPAPATAAPPGGGARTS